MSVQAMLNVLSNLTLPLKSGKFIIICLIRASLQAGTIAFEFIKLKVAEIF